MKADIRLSAEYDALEVKVLRVRTEADTSCTLYSDESKAGGEVVATILVEEEAAEPEAATTEDAKS